MISYTGIFSGILLNFSVIFFSYFEKHIFYKHISVATSEKLLSKSVDWFLYDAGFNWNGIFEQTIIQKQPLEVFYKNRYFTKMYSTKILEKIHVTILIFSFSKVAVLQSSTFLRNELFLRYFSRILNTGRKQPWGLFW